jgi:RNA polymerase sigma-70 factor (ECF subfamily)
VQGNDVETDLEVDLERLYREQGPRLWRALVLSTGSRDVAEDAVAEAFAQAIARGDALVDPAAWIWRAAFRIAMGELKTRSMSGPIPSDVASPEAPDSVVDLVRALSKLTPHQRRAVILSDYAGYPHREIARILGSSVSAVGVHVHRARRRLRRLLEDADA